VEGEIKGRDEDGRGTRRWGWRREEGEKRNEGERKGVDPGQRRGTRGRLVMEERGDGDGRCGREEAEIRE
jgi:hypothetical protein